MTDIDWGQLEKDREEGGVEVCVRNVTALRLVRRVERLAALEAYALTAKRQLEAADRLVARIREWEPDNITDENCRDWLGHVEPALAAYEAAKGGGE